MPDLHHLLIQSVFILIILLTDKMKAFDFVIDDDEEIIEFLRYARRPQYCFDGP